MSSAGAARAQPSEPGTSELLHLEDIGKVYGSTSVLRHLNLTLEAGTCVALMGENGAGKSTAIRIMSGLVRPSEGRLYWQGTPVSFARPRDARALGIVVIPQELAFVPDLSVAENVLLGSWPSRVGLTSRAAIAEAAGAQLERIGMRLDVGVPMRSLTLAERQLVEIAKAIAFNSTVLLLDEPTAALNQEEAARLLAFLLSLKESGTSLVYVSHRLEDLRAIADRVCVLRNGELVASLTREEATTEAVVRHMLGHAAEIERQIGRMTQQAAKPNEAPVLELKSWSREGIPSMRDVSLSVSRGEVVGIYGVLGSGAESLVRGLGGHERVSSGTILVDGERVPLFRHPRAARRAGIAYVPADRKSDGLVLTQSVRESITIRVLGRFSRWGLVRRRLQDRRAQALVAQFDIRVRDLATPVGWLSGGNQQRVLLASRLAEPARALVLHEPTRGVDVGARAEIHRHLRATADEGNAVIVVTSDLEEAVLVSDRLLVMRGGQVVAELSGDAKGTAAAFAAAAEAGGVLDRGS